MKIEFESIKYGLEYLWVGALLIDKGNLKGILENTLQGGKYQEGDTVVIEKDKVADWMYNEIINDSTHKTRGEYTLQVIRKSLPPEEREEYDRSGGIYLDDYN